MFFRFSVGGSNRLKSKRANGEASPIDMIQQYIQRALYLFVFNFLLTSFANAEGKGSTAGDPYGAPASQGTFFLYAYVQAGELINWNIQKTLGSGTNDVFWDVTVYSPFGIEATGVVTDVVGNNFTSTPVTVSAATAGIWTLKVTPRQPFGNQTSNAVSYDLSVYTAGAVPITGRVFTYKINGLTNAATIENFSLYFLTPDGYQYKATYKEMNGYSYALQSDQYGLRTAATTCISSRKSITRIYGFGPNPGLCGSSNKIFFNPFSTSLPRASQRMNIATGVGQITEKLLFPPGEVSIQSLLFTPADSCIKSGSTSFVVSNYAGQGTISYDVNNNGSYTDAIDRIDSVNFNDGFSSFAFDGLDGLGNRIPASQAMGILAGFDKLGEIHFILDDVEILRGGIEVTRLNGAGAPDQTLYWDDSNFPLNTNCTVTSIPVATAGINSAGGVHAWSACATEAETNPQPPIPNIDRGSWGNFRVIDNWAYLVPVNSYLQITVPAITAPAPIFTMPMSYCQSGSAIALPTVSDNGVTGTWSPLFSTAVAGTVDYTFTPSAGQCASTITLPITIRPKPQGETFKTICSNQLPFLWNGTLYTAAAIDTLQLINANGCDSVNIFHLQLADTLRSVTERTVCSTALPYPWEGNSIAAAGTYQQLLPSAAGCDSLAQLVLTVENPPLPNLGTDTTLCAGETMLLSPGAFTTYSWSNGTAGSSLLISQPGMYSVTVTNTCGTATDYKELEPAFCNLYFPNAFAPNGVNKIFRALGISSVEKYSLQVYNRWGEAVFASADINKGWDGTWKGQPAGMGAYAWHCSYTRNGKQFSIKGMVTLLR
jgi:gliding motility-associated-like protein